MRPAAACRAFPIRNYLPQSAASHHARAISLCDFLAKDEGGKNDIATAIGAAARINFLIMLNPLAKA
jgi:hypothetical protein